MVRSQGQGSVVLTTDSDFEILATRFPVLPGICSIIRIEMTRVFASCGDRVP